MKIGSFAACNNISIDTVRYYMELKLIIPQRIGGQYEFNDRCQSDMEEIIWLKYADFTLNEIQRIFSLKRMTSLKGNEDMQYYMSLFINKKNELMQKRNELDLILERLEKKINELESMKTDEGDKLGLPLEFLQLLVCPDCGKKMKLDSGNIENGMLIDGKLSCGCKADQGGSGFEIIDGMIVCKKDSIDNPHAELKIDGHFIEQTSSDYINLLYKSGQWISNKIDFKSAENVIFLEPGTGSGLFLNAVIKDLREECIYICVDHNLELLKDTKKTIERHGANTNIIFICCDFRRIPLGDSSVDIVIDHFGTTNFNFQNEGFLFNILDRLVKPGGKWLGDYFSFMPGAKSLEQLEKRFRNYFYSQNIKDGLNSSCFKVTEIIEMGHTQKGGVYERFFIDGDILYDCVCYGVKPLID